MNLLGDWNGPALPHTVQVSIEFRSVVLKLLALAWLHAFTCFKRHPHSFSSGGIWRWLFHYIGMNPEKFYKWLCINSLRTGSTMRINRYNKIFKGKPEFSKSENSGIVLCVCTLIHMQVTCRPQDWAVAFTRHLYLWQIELHTLKDEKRYRVFSHRIFVPNGYWICN